MTDLSKELKRLGDESEIRSLAFRYAQSVDRRDAAVLTSLFTEDGAIIGSRIGLSVRGRSAIAQIPPSLAARYDRTYHVVYNHLISVAGDQAEGEIYSQAHHLKQQQDGRTSDFIMAITYRDRYVRSEGAWRFHHRDLDVQWTQTLWVDPAAAG